MNIIDYFDKICYINLDEDVNKKEYFQQEIKKSILHPVCERYTAVIGKYLDIRLVPDSIITENAKNDIILKKQKIYGISLTYGSLACALSHYFLYRDCSVSKKPYLIFEDDIIINRAFDSSLFNIINSLQQMNYDLMYLGYNNIPGFTKQDISEFIAKPSGLITGMYAYIVTPQGAQKLLNTIFPLNKQIDSSISDNGDRFEKLCSTNPIVQVRVDFGSKTQMDNSCVNNYSFDSPVEKIDTWNKLFI